MTRPKISLPCKVSTHARLLEPFIGLLQHHAPSILLTREMRYKVNGHRREEDVKQKASPRDAILALKSGATDGRRILHQHSHPDLQLT